MSSKSLRRFVVLGGVALALGCVGAGLAIASNASSRFARGTNMTARERATLRRQRSLVLNGQPRRLPNVLVANFRVFRAASSARAHADAGPAGAFPGVPKDIAATWGLAAGDATAINNSVALNLWLVPGTSGTCFVWKDLTPKYGTGGGGCVPNSMAVAGEMATIMGRPEKGDAIAIGLVPNGNSTVTLSHTDGTSQSVPVSDNVYVGESTHGFKAVTLRGAQGAVVSRSLPGGP